MQLDALVVSSAAQAVLSGYVGQALGAGAKTDARRDLAKTFFGIAAYSVFIGATYVFEYRPIREVTNGLALLSAFASTAYLLRFSHRLAGGTESGARALRWLVAAIGIATLVAFGRLLQLGLTHRNTNLPTGILNGSLLLLFIAVAVLLGRAGFGSTKEYGAAARAYLAGAVWPLAPIIVVIADSAGAPVSAGLYMVVRDLSVLFYCYGLVIAYMEYGSEPISLRVRFVAGGLTLVFVVIVVTCQVFLERGMTRQAAYMLALTLASALFVVLLFPRFYRRTLFEPLDRLGEGMRQVETGTLDVRVPIANDDELGYLARSFNRMVENLATQQAELTERLDELSEKNREVAALNDELRLQVAARSRELATLLENTDGGSASLRFGQVIGERYRVSSHLGSGAMGSVFAVERITDEKRFALKIMHGSTTGIAASRFAREAEIAAKLAHENLVSVVDVGLDRGRAYLVMELVAGASLEDRRSDFGDAKLAFEALRQMAAGLAELHDHGVVHRDLKPANVLVAERSDGTWQVKIGDFGIARQEDVDALAETVSPGGGAESPGLTKTGVMLGTLPYMAPELRDGARGVGPASDVFGFGIIAHELYAKESPFAVPPVFTAASRRPLPEPAPLPDTVPASLRAILRACLSEDPNDRPTARELCHAFGSLSDDVATA